MLFFFSIFFFRRSTIGKCWKFINRKFSDLYIYRLTCVFCICCDRRNYLCLQWQWQEKCADKNAYDLICSWFGIYKACSYQIEDSTPDTIYVSYKIEFLILNVEHVVKLDTYHFRAILSKAYMSNEWKKKHFFLFLPVSIYILAMNAANFKQCFTIFIALDIFVCIMWIRKQNILAISDNYFIIYIILYIHHT